VWLNEELGFNVPRGTGAAAAEAAAKAARARAVRICFMYCSKRYGLLYYKWKLMYTANMAKYTTYDPQ
jgi:hypothetical protein